MGNIIINWNVDPVIFWLTDSFPIKYYGFLFVSGLLLGFSLVQWIYKKENIPLESLDKLATYIFIGTFIGARLGHCLFYQPEYFLQNPIEIFLPIIKVGNSYKFIGFQGLASHGGGIGVLIAIILFCRNTKTNLLWVLDRVAIASPIAGAFIRFGNLMNSEIIGKPTNGNWGVIFQRVDLIPRHPAQLYEAVTYLIIFGILFYVYKNKNIQKKDGLIFGLLLTLIFSARFIIEFFKENQVGFENGMFINMGQILSIPFIIIGLIFVFRKGKKGK